MSASLARLLLECLEHAQICLHQARRAYQAHEQALPSLVEAAYQPVQQGRLESLLASHLAGQPKQQALRGRHSAGQEAQQEQQDRLTKPVRWAVHR